MIALPIINTNPSYAECGDPFLGMQPWYAGLTDGDCHVTPPASREDLTRIVWTAVANVVSSIAGLVAIIAIGFVIYGGYLYMFSGGDPTKASSGQKTLTSAFIGIGICLLAKVIFGTITAVIGASSLETDVNGLGKAQSGEVINNVIEWFIGVAGFVAAIFLVFGAISYITASGDPGKAKKAQGAIKNAIIGLLIVGFAQLIVSTLYGVINSNGGTTNNGGGDSSQNGN